MAKCDKMSTCAFYQNALTDMPATAELLKMQYCHRDFEVCARHRVEEKLGSTCVPRSLVPDESRLADRIVAGT